MNTWGGATYGDLSVEGIEGMHFERLGDTPERMEALTITKRLGPSGACHRAVAGSSPH